VEIKNAVKTILSNPFNALAVTKYAIPTTAIHTPAHKEWREKQCFETYDRLKTDDCLASFEEYREDWFSEPDYLLVDVTQLKDNTRQVVCFVDYHKPNIRAESEPEHLWQYTFPNEPTLQDVFIAKMRDLAELVKDDFISEYRDSDNNVTITDIKECDGYIPLNDYELEVTEFYRNDCDPCSHFTDAQTAFNSAKSDALLKDFKNEFPRLDEQSDEFADWESEAFEQAQLIVEIKLKDDVVTIRCCVDYGRTNYSGAALVDNLFEYTPEFLTPNENIIEQMKGLINAVKVPRSAEYLDTHVLIIDNRPFVTIKTYRTDSRTYQVFCLEEGSDHTLMSSYHSTCIEARMFEGLTALGFTLQKLEGLDRYGAANAYLDQIAAQNEAAVYYKTRI
jgi:hypothetical protein